VNPKAWVLFAATSVILGESLTTGAVAGLILIALGAWLATSRPADGAVSGTSGGQRSRRDEICDSKER
jgi:hypothetical protein